MQIKTSLKVITLAIASLAASVAIAAPHESGAYVEGNIGTNYASVNFFGLSYSTFGSIGFNANLGYQFQRYLATEVGYTNYYGGINNIDLALKVILPFQIGNNDASIFGKIGPAFIFTGSDQSLVPFLGVGASYALTSNLDATVQAQGVTEGFFSLGLLSGGLTYHFS